MERGLGSSPSSSTSFAHAPQPVARRALVIDDEPKTLTVLRRALGGAHDVVGASSGREALTRIRNGESYDVILCDLMMPEMNGMQVFAEIERLAPHLARRVIFLTGGAFTAEGA